MWWEHFNHFGWVYYLTNDLGQLTFCTNNLSEIAVSKTVAETAPIITQRLLEQHIEHIVLHLAGRFAYPCHICNDQLVGLQDSTTYNPATDMAFVGFKEGYKDERLR